MHLVAFATGLWCTSASIRAKSLMQHRLCQLAVAGLASICHSASIDDAFNITCETSASLLQRYDVFDRTIHRYSECLFGSKPVERTFEAFKSWQQRQRKKDQDSSQSHDPVTSDLGRYMQALRSFKDEAAL